MVSIAVGLAGRVRDEVIKAPQEPSILFPRSGGNIHSFRALTPCAILDVLSPPYSEEFGRPSTYYSDIPIPSLTGDDLINFECIILFIYLLNMFLVCTNRKMFIRFLSLNFKTSHFDFHFLKYVTCNMCLETRFESTNAL